MSRGLGIGEGKLPMKDLAIFIGSKHIPIRCYNKVLLEKVRKRLAGWKAKTLSFSGPTKVSSSSYPHVYVF